MPLCRSLTNRSGSPRLLHSCLDDPLQIAHYHKIAHFCASHSIGHNGVDKSNLVHAGNRYIPIRPSEMYHMLTRPTARDLTLEAARDAGAARRPNRPLPAAQIKKLLDSRSQADVLDGLRRVVSVRNGFHDSNDLMLISPDAI